VPYECCISHLAADGKVYRHGGTPAIADVALVMIGDYVVEYTKVQGMHRPKY
jgi:hypothetical protein